MQVGAGSIRSRRGIRRRIVISRLGGRVRFKFLGYLDLRGVWKLDQIERCTKCSTSSAVCCDAMRCAECVGEKKATDPSNQRDAVQLGVPATQV